MGLVNASADRSYDRKKRCRHTASLESRWETGKIEEAGEICIGILSDAKLTLGLSEQLLLNTRLDGLVELDIKGALRRDVELVVRLNILLDSLATVANPLVTLL